MGERLVLDPSGAVDPEVGRWLAALRDSRRRTLEALDGLDPATLDRTPEGPDNSIGSLLYHVAAIEADWLFEEILGPDRSQPWPDALFPFEVRDGEGRLTEIHGVPLHDHLERLSAVRELFLAVVTAMDSEEFHRIRMLEAYDVSPDWVVHHLMQHEAEHRAQISALRKVGI
jgi:uncharacterized damage-inducible protein DinB